MFAFNLAQEEFDQEIFRSPETTYQKWLDEQSHHKASEIAEESGVVAQFMEWLENPETRLVPPQNRAESLALTTLTNLNMNAIEETIADSVDAANRRVFGAGAGGFKSFHLCCISTPLATQLRFVKEVLPSISWRILLGRCALIQKLV